MRRISLLAAMMAAIVAPTVAWAKLPFFGLEAAPLRPRVGEPITITMTCYEDPDQIQASSSCFGAGDSMAWVHPLDREGSLDLGDWLPVAGRQTPDGTVRGTIALAEPGAYDVLPLWRGWGHDHSSGFPDPIRIEVGNDRGPLILGVTSAGVGMTVLVTTLLRRRRPRTPLSGLTPRGRPSTS